MRHQAARVKPANHLIHAAPFVSVSELPHAGVGRAIQRHRLITLLPSDSLHALADLAPVRVRGRAVALAQARLLAYGAKIVHEAGFDLPADLCLTIGHVDRKEDRDIFRFPAVPGRTERAAIPVKVLRELGKRVDRRGDEYRIPALPGEPRGLWAVRSNAQRRVGFLQRLGHHSGVRHLKILAVKPAGLLGPRLLEDRQRFLEALATLIA